MPNTAPVKPLTKSVKTKKIYDRQEFLDKVSDILFTSFNDEQTIKKVAQLILSYLADYCRIVTLDEKNNISDISVNHTDPTKVQLVTDLYDEYKDEANATQGVHKILETGKTELVPVIDKNVLDSIKSNPKLIQIVKDIGLKSYMGIPLTVKGKIIGAITFSSVRPNRIYGLDDLSFAKEIGRRIALALDNARLYRETAKARQEAEQERQRLYDLFMQAPAMVAITRGPNHVYELANPLYLKATGKSNSIIGKSISSVLPELKEQGIIGILDDAYKNGRPFIGSELQVKLDIENTGHPVDRYFNFVYQPSKNISGKIDGILVHAIDITDMVIARQNVERREKYFRALIEHSADAIALASAAGIVIYASASVKKLLGYRADEMLGKPGSVFVHPADLAAIRKKVSGVAGSSGTALTVEHRVIHKNGSIRWMETTVTNLLEEPSVGAVVTNFRDITERKLAEQRLRESEQRARAVFDQAASAISLTTLDGRWIEFNKVYPKMFGYSTAELAKMTFTQITHPDDREQDKASVARLLSGELKEYAREKRYMHKNGSIVYALIHVTVVRDESGDPKYLIAILQDITKRKQAEEKLRNSEERFTLAQQAANIGSFEWKIQTGEFVCTPQLELLYELRPGALKGKYANWLKMLHREDRARVESELQAAIQGQRLDTEFRILRPDKTIRWMAVRGRVFKDKNGQAERLLGINRNITKRKQTEEHLRESEERLRFMAESLPQKVFTAEVTGNIDYFNPQWMEYTGLTFEQIKGWGWVQFVHPDDVDENVRRWQLSIDSGKPFEMEHRFRRYDGKYRWHISRAQPMRDDSGKIIRWFGSNTDIDDMRRTTKRKNELEKITSVLTAQRAELMELNRAKDEFISLASHQLRTPATGVKQYLGMTLEGYAGELNENQAAFLREAYASNERQINIVNDLLQVAKIDAGKVVLEKETIDLISLIKNILQEQSTTFSDKKQKVVFTPPSAVFGVVADRNRMRMVVENIIDNASKYTPEKKRIDITLSRTKAVIKIAVKDQGVGVDKPDIHKIFDKFSRIDNPLSVAVGGTGLGLYWAKKIIDLHGGTIEVDSKLGRGSTFTISIPAVSDRES